MTKSRINMRPGESAGRSRWVSVSAARLFLKKQLWIWPLLAAVMLFCVGYWLRSSVNQSLKDSLASQLQVVLDADVAALEEWFALQEATASAAAEDNDVVDAINQMETFASHETSSLRLANSSQLAAVKNALAPWIDVGDYEDYVVISRNKRIVASSREEILGKEAPGNYAKLLERVLTGEAIVSPPFQSVVMLKDSRGQERSGVPTMFVCAPVHHAADNSIIAALCLRVDPDGKFTSVLQLARLGKSGETYAFDKSGLLLSQSRFDDQLKYIGLLTDDDNTISALSIELRDPGIDMTRGGRPQVHRKQQPLTYPVQQAIAGTTGVSVDPRRDYRGVEQLSAWTWLKKYGMGIVTEVDYAEAMAPARMVDLAFWTMFGLLAALSVAIMAFSFVVARLQQRMQKEALKQQRLGQYQLEEKLGEGGMGVVYRGRHALLRRPTAIKLLDINKVNEASTARFEREVQLTSQLNHPNTIAIYDYGRTPEGIFYYAMEFLDGMDLERLVTRYGPQPEGRVIQILLQVCGSLAEAHILGMVHRDIKPANIMLCQRGGLTDFVKVLDFGLVKALDQERAKTLTAADSITGTPMYISPEGIERPQDVDARSDIYAVGAVGYYVLTGKQPFDAANIVDLCMKVVSTPPLKPSERLGKQASPELEAILLKCLAKRPEDRFSTIEELAEALRHCAAALPWSENDSAKWWSANIDRGFGTSTSPTPAADGATRTLVWAPGSPQ